MLPHKDKDAVEAGILIESERGEIVNASGHKDQLQRQYGLLSICGLALTIDNAWVALGGSITVSICMSPAQLLTRGEAVVLMEMQTMADHRASYTSSLSHASITASLPHPSQRYIIFSPRFSFRSHLPAGIRNPLSRRGLPLGLRDPRSPLRPHHWLLHRLFKLLRLDFRPRVYRLHSRQRGRSNVCHLSPGSRNRSLAYLRCFCHHNMVVLRLHHLRQSLPSLPEQMRAFPDHRWRTRNNHRRGGDAEDARQQFVRVERVEQPGRMAEWGDVFDGRAEWGIYHWDTGCSHPYVRGTTQSAKGYAEGHCGAGDPGNDQYDSSDVCLEIPQADAPQPLSSMPSPFFTPSQTLMLSWAPMAPFL